MENLFIGIFVMVFVGCVFLCTMNRYAVVAGLVIIAIATFLCTICLCIWVDSDD